MKNDKCIGHEIVFKSLLDHFSKDHDNVEIQSYLKKKDDVYNVHYTYTKGESYCGCITNIKASEFLK